MIQKLPPFFLSRFVTPYLFGASMQSRYVFLQLAIMAFQGQCLTRRTDRPRIATSASSLQSSLCRRACLPLMLLIIPMKDTINLPTSRGLSQKPLSFAFSCDRFTNSVIVINRSPFLLLLSRCNSRHICHSGFALVQARTFHLLRLIAGYFFSALSTAWSLLRSKLL